MRGFVFASLILEAASPLAIRGILNHKGLLSVTKPVQPEVYPSSNYMTFILQCVNFGI